MVVVADFAIFAAALDAFVAVLVKVGEVLPKFLVGYIDNVTVLDGSELGRQVPDCGDVEFVLVGLEVSKLGELLAAVIESAEIWFGCIVNDLVGANISALSEPLSTDFAWVWSFACMATLVSLEVSKLRETSTTSRFFA